MIPRYLVNFDLEDLPGVGFDLVVVGSGVAGLSTALRAARRFRVALLTKTTLTVTATRIAQGGIASALGADDSPELHFEDTIKAGKGLCEEEAVWTLVREGPRRITELIEEVGAHFDVARNLAFYRPAEEEVQLLGVLVFRERGLRLAEVEVPVAVDFKRTGGCA